MELEFLEKMGLSKGEIKVYKVILNLGICSINKIHENVGIERRNIYDIINKLIDRGLISYVTENKKRLFRTTHPNKLLGYLDEKEEIILLTKTDLVDEKTLKKAQKDLAILKRRVFAISAYDDESVKNFADELVKLLRKKEK